MANIQTPSPAKGILQKRNEWLGPLIIAGVLLLVFVVSGLRVISFYHAQTGDTTVGTVIRSDGATGQGSKIPEYTYTVKDSSGATHTLKTTGLYHAVGDTVTIVSAQQGASANQQGNLSIVDTAAIIVLVLSAVCLILLAVSAVRGQLN